MQPVSAMAWCIGGIGIGGPGGYGGSTFVCSDESVESHKLEVLLLSWTLSGDMHVFATLLRGSRRSQPRGSDGVPVLGPVLLRDRYMKVVEPFIIFFKVASVLWPGLGLLHVMDVWFLNCVNPQEWQ